MMSLQFFSLRNSAQTLSLAFVVLRSSADLRISLFPLHSRIYRFSQVFLIDTKTVSKQRSGQILGVDYPAKTSASTNLNPLHASCCLFCASGTSRRKPSPCTSLTRSRIISLNIDRF